MFYKAPLWKTFPELSKGLSKHTLGPKLFLFPFLSVFFSLCFSVPTCYTLLVQAAEWAPVFRPLLSCDLWSVWTAWPTEAARRREPRDTHIRAKETRHNSNLKAVNQCIHVTRINCTLMWVRWKYDIYGDCNTLLGLRCVRAKPPY